VAHFKVLSQYSLGRNEENQTSHSEDTLWTGREAETPLQSG
jgi:hypothetical protein